MFFLPVCMRQSPSSHVRVPTGGTQCGTSAGMQLTYCVTVNTPDCEAQIQIITKGTVKGEAMGCDSRHRDHKLQLNSSIDQFILTDDDTTK